MIKYLPNEIQHKMDSLLCICITII